MAILSLGDPAETTTHRGDIFSLGRDVTVSRAVGYAINSSADHMSPEARESMAIIAQRLGQLLGTTRPGDSGAPAHWRAIAAAALQLEARALGLRYSLGPDDKPLTPD